MSAQDIAIALEHQTALADKIVATLLAPANDIDQLDAAIRLAETYSARYPEADYIGLRDEVMTAYYAQGFGTVQEFHEQDEAWEEHKGHFTDGEDAAAAAAETEQQA